ncbi:MAG: dienelactone hydrolase family protein [Patulibacter sp.]|nr:dienelactone hydrolase family protein [Patulibacter sp.]
MCFERDASPPDVPADRRLPTVAGGAAAERLTLVAEDGTHSAAALATTTRSQGAGVIVLPDVRGLYRFYVELAERFASAGHHAIAIDYFGRTAGTAERTDDFEWMPHLVQTGPATIQLDVAVAAATLRERTGVERVAVVGFCFGGTHAFVAATAPDLQIDRAIGFYGTLSNSRTNAPFMPSALDHAPRTRRPVLALFGGDDPLIPTEDVAAFEGGLRASGVAHEAVSYPGAPHSFFDRAADRHREASADAWNRVLDDLADVSAVPDKGVNG